MWRSVASSTLSRTEIMFTRSQKAAVARHEPALTPDGYNGSSKKATRLQTTLLSGFLGAGMGRFCKLALHAESKGCCCYCQERCSHISDLI